MVHMCAIQWNSIFFINLLNLLLLFICIESYVFVFMLAFQVPDPFWDEPHPGVKDCFSSYKKLLYATVPSIKQVRTSGLAVADAVSTDSRSLSGSRATVADMKKKLRDSLAMSAVASDIHRDHFWGGKWLPYPTANPAYIHSWLPNNR